MKTNLKGRIGDRLLAAGLINEAQLLEAVERKRLHGGFLGDLLVEMGYVTARAVGEMLAQATSAEYVSLDEVEIQPEATALVDEMYQRTNWLLPYRIDGDVLYVAMSDPLNIVALDDLQMMTGHRIHPTLSLTLELRHAFGRLFSIQSAADDVLREIVDSPDDSAGQELSTFELAGMAEDAPIIKLVERIMQGGINDGASDIHIEPQERCVRVRYRLDGMLAEKMTYPRVHHQAVVSRLKIMARLNIAERRRPQDGKIAIQSRSHDYDLRISTMLMAHGEAVVMRILKSADFRERLDALGFYPDQLALWESLLERPYGMILVTGPTGSGKTTTLYSSLHKIVDVTRNVLTVEDPIEYNLPGVNQSQVNPHIGVTFASGLRTIVRQDPDVIMVGEIRDRETAEIAVQAALTGHLVFSTLHTNDAASAPIRLKYMGVEPFLITSAVIGVAAQRLVRKICLNCAEPDMPEPDLVRAIGLDPKIAHSGVLRRGKGCAECGGRGYRGRIAVFEIMSISDGIREAVLSGMGAPPIRAMAISEGMTTMRQAGIQRAVDGQTALVEAARVLLVDRARYAAAGMEPSEDVLLQAA